MPSRLRKAIASMPSAAKCTRTGIPESRNASRVSRASPGLSSTKRTSMDIPSSFNLIPLAAVQGEAEGRSHSRLRLDRNLSAMALHDLLAYRQADARAGKLFPLVQALEHAENSLEILRVDSEPIVLNGEAILLAAIQRSDMDSGSSGILILDGVADQILKQLNKLHLVRQNVG